jgi:hypothetical protein
MLYFYASEKTTHMKQLSLFLFAAILATNLSAQELKLPALSPTCKITQEFSTSSIEISYSRPSMRGRKIFGDLVPYGQVWRTGANSATKVKFGEEMILGGQTIKAGEYALYTIPDTKEWTVILNKGIGNWGQYGYDTNDDIARFKIVPKNKEGNTQTFTINITNITYSTCNIEMAWEKTKLVIPVKANNEERLNTAIDKAVNNPTIPYFSAANYYFETNQKLDLAYSYVNKALETNPKAFYMWNLKARLAQKLGKKEDAITAAEKSIETAKGGAAELEYTTKANKIIAEVKKS